MIILKLGGSILTKKDLKDPEINYTNLNRIANEIKTAFDNKSNNNELSEGLIIIHGAGSFGHPPAKKYSIGEVFTEEQYPKKELDFQQLKIVLKNSTHLFVTCLSIMKYLVYRCKLHHLSLQRIKELIALI